MFGWTYSTAELTERAVEKDDQMTATPTTTLRNTRRGPRRGHGTDAGPRDPRPNGGARRFPTWVSALLDNCPVDRQAP